MYCFKSRPHIAHVRKHVKLMSKRNCVFRLDMRRIFSAYTKDIILIKPSRRKVKKNILRQNGLKIVIFQIFFKSHERRFSFFRISLFLNYLLFTGKTILPSAMGLCRAYRQRYIRDSACRLALYSVYIAQEATTCLLRSV